MYSQPVIRDIGLIGPTKSNPHFIYGFSGSMGYMGIRSLLLGCPNLLLMSQCFVNICTSLLNKEHHSPAWNTFLIVPSFLRFPPAIPWCASSSTACFLCFGTHLPMIWLGPFLYSYLDMTVKIPLLRANCLLLSLNHYLGNW